MKPSRTFWGFIVCGQLALAACGSADSDERADPDGAGAPLAPLTNGGGNQDPPAGTNGQLPSCFWAHGSQQALRTLGAGAIDAGGGVIPSVSTTLVPAECRQVIGNAVACALPRGQSLSDPVTGDHYDGWWGLATSWAGGALGPDARRYVTGCMLQRLNASGTSVPIALEGPAGVIAADASLGSAYPIEESTVFGDLFSSTVPLFSGLPAFSAYVCWEDLLPQSCGPLGLPLLEQRVCDDVPLCGLTTLGACGLTCAHNGDYWKCKPPLALLSPYWTQTVRVRLATETCQ